MPTNGYDCIICGGPCSGKRRKFCSDACYRIDLREGRRVRHPRARRRLRSPHAAGRVCLACDRTFLSEGPWNRICPRCNSRQGKNPAPPSRYHSIGLPAEIPHLRGDAFIHGGGKI